jgi:outer membrane protein assembly factor BamB
MKKRAGAGLAVVLAAVAGAAAQNPRAVYTDPAPPPREVLDRLNLAMAWRAFVPTEGRRDGFASIQMSDKDLVIQTRSGSVHLLDAETGVTRWRARVGRPYEVTQPPAFNSRSVFVINSTFLYSLDRASGALQWQFRLPGGLAAPPVADEDLIYIVSAAGRVYAYYLPRLAAPAPPLLESAEVRRAPGTEPPGERAVTLYEKGKRSTGAISPLSSSVREAGQEVETGPQPLLLWDYVPNLTVERRPLLTSVFLVLPCADGTVLALGRVPGADRIAREEYRFSMSGGLAVAPGQYSETAFFGAQDANLYALNLTTGKLLWRHTAGGAIAHRPAATDEDVYLTSGGNGLTRLDRTTGEPRWRVPRGNRVFTSNPGADRFLAANPKFVYAADPSGRLLVLDRRYGTCLSGFDTHAFAFPVTNEQTDRLYLAANNGLLVCLHDRQYESPYVQRRLEESSGNPLRQKLAQPVTEAGTPALSLREALEGLQKRHGVKYRIAQDAFKLAGVERVEAQQVRIPKVDNRPLGEVLQQVLDQVKASHTVVGDTILIFPAELKPKGP